MKEEIKNKLNLETTDLLDKLIEPSKSMENILKELFNLEFDKNTENSVNYNCIGWVINDELKTYNCVYGNSDIYTEKIFVDSDLIQQKDKEIKSEVYLNIRNRFIPNRNETQQNILIDFLKEKLVKEGVWKTFGPKTFIHDKTDDKILVYVRADTFHIVHDGNNVIDNFSIEWFSFDTKEIEEEGLMFYIGKINDHF